MKIKLLFVILFFSLVGRGQVTIVSDGLNNSSSLFTLSGGAYYTGNSAAGDRPASSPFAIEGTHGYGLTSGIATLTSSSFSTCGHSSVTMSLRLAAFSIGSTTNGLDSGDVVTIEVSPDDGANWYSTLRILGNSNAFWGYSGTGVASTSYDGNATPVDIQPAGGGSRTTDGYSTINITGLPSVSLLKIRITLSDDSSERWVVDDFKVQGVVTPITLSPTITSSSASQSSVYGAAITNYQILATNCPTSYTASGLPAGVTINTTTGLISGTPTVVGTYTTTITATNGIGTSTSISKDFIITPKPLTITGLTSSNKVYDGTTTSTLGGTATLSGGLVGSDVVTISGSPTANYSQSNVGTSLVITISGYSLSGADAAKYTVTQPTVTNRSITVKPLTITGLTAANKVYDGTSTATLTGTPTLSGLVGADVVSISGTPSANFSTATVGVGKAVTVTGYTITGAQAANYSVSQPTGLTANITQAPQTITFAALPDQMLSGTTFTLSATSSAGLTITYTSSNTAVATISGNVVTMLSTGSTIITASQAGNTNYAAAISVNQNQNIIIGVQEINVEGNIGTFPDITSGDITPSALDNTLFAAQVVGATQNKGFRIQNIGGNTLNVSSITLSGANPGDFSIIASAPYAIAPPNGMVLFTIDFTPVGIGVRTAIVTITSNDSDEGSYTFMIQGTGNCPVTSNTVSPTSGTVGTTVTITSTNSTLNNLSGATATFNGVSASIISTSATQMVVTIPTGATTGNLVTTNALGCTATLAFTVLTYDLCAYATNLTIGAPATTNNMTGSTTTAPFTKKDVWFSFTPSCSGIHNINVSSFSGDIDIELYSGSCPASASYLDNSNGNTSTETITSSLTAGVTYYLRVLAWNVTAETSSFAAQVTTDGVLNINNVGSPVSGNISVNTNDVVIMGFTTTPNCITNYNLNSVTITKTGTATSSDISNLRVIYDANANGIIDGGETSVSGAGIALSSSMVFSLTGQTGILTTRNYLLVGDVSISAVNGNTINASISSSNNLNATILPLGLPTGNAIGNTMTIVPPPCTAAVLSSISPTSGPIGTEITITASSGNLSGAAVKFSGISATIISSSATKIIAIVPIGATTGNVTVIDTTPCNTYIPFTIITEDRATCQGGSTDLFISELTDSNTGSLSYVEIYNGTNATINLSSYSIKTANNGQSSFSITVNLNNVDLLSGGIYVVGLGVGASSVCNVPGGDGSYANQTSGAGSINMESSKNDFIGLYKSGVLIDSWGVYGDASWAASLIATLGTDGSNFKRKTSVTVPKSAYSNADWDITDYAGSSCLNNNYTDIGNYIFPGGTPPSVTTPIVSNPTCKSATISVTGSEGFPGGNTLAYQWYYSNSGDANWTALSNTGVFSGVTSSTLSISNVSSVINYQYYCQVREILATCFIASKATKITGAITWNGTDWRDSNNVVTTPSIGKLAIINANYDTSINGSFDACSLVVNNGFTAIIAPTNYINIQYDLTLNGNLTVKSGGSLVQIDDFGLNSGTGNFVMERTATVARTTDYVYWSSPISNFQVGNVNPSSWLRYKWIPTIPRAYTSNFGGWLATPANEVMEKGKGYIIRGPYTNPTATFTNTAPNNLPNNGIIPVGVERSTYDGAPYTYLSGSTTLTVVKDDDNYNLLGNPYPSAVDVQKFLSLNTNLAGHIRLWTHGTPIQSSLFNGQSFYNSFGYTYSVLDYIYVNYTGISSGPGDYAIASGQGFFVTMNHSSASASENVIFNNSMRRDATLGTIYNNSVFYRKANTNERNRIWLDILDDKNASVRTLVGYIQGATLDKDRMYDAKATVDSNLNIYSLIQDESQIIQARAVPFDKDDRVPLGVSIPLKVGNTTSTLGTYKIAIAFVDGLFQNKNQDIYLEDKLLNVIHDLRKDPYTFESVSGRFDNRFVLRYTNKNKSLGTEHFKEYRNSIVVAADAGQVKIISSIEAIKKVAVYDIFGREIFTKNNINALELSIKDIIINRQALVVKVVLENGQEISKKIIL